MLKNPVVSERISLSKIGWNPGNRVRSRRRPADRDEDRRPHGLQDRSEHLHARAGRDAPEGDGESGRGVREQGDVLKGWNYDDSGCLARSFCFLVC